MNRYGTNTPWLDKEQNQQRVNEDERHGGESEATLCKHQAWMNAACCSSAGPDGRGMNEWVGGGSSRDLIVLAPGLVSASTLQRCNNCLAAPGSKVGVKDLLTPAGV